MSEQLLPPIAGVRAGEPGRVDELLSTLAVQLTQSGLKLAGVVQQDVERPERCRCDMTLHILGTDLNYPISTDLGPLSQGCRLDSEALEQAVWEVESMLISSTGKALPQLLIINKFGNSEAQGKGFMPVIALAAELGIPVLCGVGRLCLDEFSAFTDGQAELLEPSKASVEQWVTACLPTLTITGVETPLSSHLNSPEAFTQR